MWTKGEAAPQRCYDHTSRIKKKTQNLSKKRKAKKGHEYVELLDRAQGALVSGNARTDMIKNGSCIEDVDHKEQDEIKTSNAVIH